MNSKNILVVAVIALGVVCGMNADDKKGSKKALLDANKGRLIIFPRMPKDYDKDKRYISNVLITKGGKLIANVRTFFQKPIVVDGLPSGKVTIDLRPAFVAPSSKNIIGIKGRGDAVIASKQIVKTKIAMTMVHPSIVTIKILDIDGKPLAKRYIDLVNVSESYVTESISRLTNEKGKLKAVIYPQGQYECRFNRKAGYGLVRYRSDKIQLANMDSDREIVWKIREPPKLIFNIFTKQKDLPIGKITNLTTIFVSDGQVEGFGNSVRDGRVVVSASHPWVRNAKSVRVSIRNTTADITADEYFEVDEKVFEIDPASRKDQVLKVEVVAPKRCVAKYVTNSPSELCYLIEEKKGIRKVLAVLRNGESSKLRFGVYQVCYWGKGRSLARKTLKVSSRTTKILKCELEKAPLYKGKVVGASGVGVKEANVSFRYKAIPPPYAPWVRTETNKAGDFELSINENESGILSVKTKGLCGKWLEINADDLKFGTIQLEKSRIVKGQLIFSEQMKRNLEKTNERPQLFFYCDSKDHGQFAKAWVERETKL